MNPKFPFPFSLTAALLAVPVLILALIFLILYPNEFHLRALTSLRQQPASADFTGPVIVKPDFKLLIGILTRAELYERRNLLRLVYSLQTPPPNVVIDVKFVFCNLTKDEQRVLVALEIMKYDDIIILGCPENMDYGKTYTYFSSLPRLLNDTSERGGPPYDYIMKADDDIYFRLSRLADSLRRKPREDMYYGFRIPRTRMDPHLNYMSGMGYILSWDLVEWIAISDIPRKHTVGPEDLLIGVWLRDGNRAKNRFDTKPAMYNFPGDDVNSHEFVPDTIAVHRLKNRSKWVRTLKYFNVTDGLKPSEFYHFD